MRRQCITSESAVSGNLHDVLVIIGSPVRLPRWDPDWNQCCLACRHVDQHVDRLGVRILRCKRTRLVGGGSGQRRDLHGYCIDNLQECNSNGWFERSHDER